MQLQDELLKVTTELQTVSKQPTNTPSVHQAQESMADCVCAQAWRTYYQYHSDYVCAEGKLKEAEKQEEKQKQSAAKKLGRLIKKVNENPFVHNYVCVCIYICLFHMLLIVVYVSQRQGKVQETFLKCSKARNEYLLNLDAANASVKKYYLQDISALIDVSVLVHAPVHLSV